LDFCWLGFQKHSRIPSGWFISRFTSGSTSFLCLFTTSLNRGLVIDYYLISVWHCKPIGQCVCSSCVRMWLCHECMWVRGEKTSSLSLFDFNSWLNLMRIPGKSKGCSSNVTEVPGMLQGFRRGMGVYIHFFFQMVGFFLFFFGPVSIFQSTILC